MTELYIDKQLVVLPENFSITIIEENPFFTKNGVYTYDITLSLLDPINAMIYNHLNRKNRKGDIPKNRSAYLIVDNEVVLNGTEIILEPTESQVKIQLVSGNSELNFLIGGNKSVRSLDLGKAEKYIRGSTPETSIERQVFLDIDKTYPERGWQLLPFVPGYTDDVFDSNPNHKSYPVIGNWFGFLNFFSNDNPPINTPMPLYTSGRCGQVPQPYLCFIIEKVISASGYTLSYNALARHKYWKDAYIVNGIQTLEFALMLPEWTVDEFLSKIEQFFDCTFIVDAYNKSVRLLFNYQADSDEFGKVQIEILDEFTEEIDNENKLVVQSSNIGYALDDNVYTKFMRLENRIKSFATVIDTEYTLQEWFNRVKVSDTDSIFNLTDQQAQFVAYQNGSGTTSLKKVECFKSLMNNPDSDNLDIQFDIIPASMVYFPITASFTLPGSRREYWVQVPVTEDYDPFFDFNEAGSTIDPTEKINIQQMIEGDKETETNIVPSKIRLAFYSGMKIISQKSGDTFDFGYPTPYVEHLEECYPETRKERYFNDKDADPFRLENMYKNIYSKAESIDTTKTYKLTFVNPGKINIMSKYIANNKNYRCVKTERELTEKGFDQLFKGEFYPYN